MGYIDLLDKEYSEFMDGFLDRTERIIYKELKEKCQKYQELLKEQANLDNNSVVIKVFENDTLEKKTYSYEDILCIQQYYEIIQRKSRYENLAFYKQGIRDSLTIKEILKID